MTTHMFYSITLRRVSVKSFLVCFFLVWSFAAPAQFAFAQSVDTVEPAPSQSEPAPSAAVVEFKRLLMDPEIQKWLQQAAINTADSELAEPPAMRKRFSHMIAKIRQRIEDLVEAGINIRSAPEIITTSWQAEISNTESLRIIIYIVIFLFVGAGFEWLYSQYTHYRLLTLELRIPENLRQRLSTAFFRALITFGSLVAFALGSLGAFLIFDWPEVIDDIVLNVLIVVLLVRVAITVSRFFLAPKVKALRLVPFTNIQSTSVHRIMAILVFIGATNFAISDVFEQIVSLSNESVPKSAALSVDIFVNLVWLLAVFYAISVVRNLFVVKSEVGQKRSVNIWPTYMTVLALAIFVLWMIDTPMLMWSLLILGLLFPITSLCRNWVDNLFDQAEKIDKLHSESVIANPESEILELDNTVGEQSNLDTDGLPGETMQLHENNVYKYETYRPIARRIVRFVVIITAVIALVLLWNRSMFALSSSTTIEGRLFGIAIDVVIAFLIADLIWVWARSAIDRRLDAYEPPEDGQAPGPEARMATLLPLLRTMLMVTLITMVALSILSSFGINVAPLLAGAGVVGVAIGFGAQALVRDVVSGIFFLIDDAFRIGEYIEVDNLRGTVEAMSVRSLRVRHHNGGVHTIPFGELKSLTNYSRDWVIMKLEFRVPFDTDLKLAKNLVKKIGAELTQNPDYCDSILQTLKFQGVRRMEEFNMVVGVKFKAKPGEQWVIRRDAYQKVRDAFDANGIIFAERNVKVEVLSDQPLDSATEKAVLGAAQNAIEVELPKGPIPDEP